MVLSQSTDLTAGKSSNKTPWLAKQKQFGSNLHGLGCSGCVPVQPRVLITLCTPTALHGALDRNHECQPQVPSLATLSRTQALTSAELYGAQTEFY